MTRLALFLTFALALAVPSVKAQQFGPTVRVNLIDESTGRNVKMDLPAPKHVFDQDYFMWAATSKFLATADAEITAFNVSNGHREWNPIFGSWPSHARIEATVQLVDGIVDWAALRQKRRNDAVREFGGKVKWYADYRTMFLGSIIGHGTGFIVGFGK